MKRLLLLIFLCSVVTWSQTAPSGYTSHYGLRKWATGAHPSSDSINANWTDIDEILYQKAGLHGKADSAVIADSAKKFNRGYKVYTGLMGQSGTSNPTVTVLGDNTIGNITWTRINIGQYVGTLTGAFTVNKTWAICLTAQNSASAIGITPTSDSTVSVSTYYVTNNGDDPPDSYVISYQPIDGQLSGLSFEIRVYP